MHFTLRQLQALVTVAETGGFTRAADHLHLSPSAVSQLILELEGSLGYKLFERSTRKVVLSPAGLAFVPSALAVLRQVELARTAAADIRDEAAGLVRVAAPLVVASVLLPEVIAAYRRKRPQVTVRLLDGRAEELVEQVASRQVDLAVGPDQPVSEAVERVVLYESPWVVWCRPGHRLARKRALTWADLCQAELVAAGRDHETHLSALMRHVPEPHRVVPVQVVDNVSTALGLAASGLCYTLSPAYVQALALPLGLVMRPIADPLPMRQMCLFRAADRLLSPAASGFAAFAAAALTAGAHPGAETPEAQAEGAAGA